MYEDKNVTIWQPDRHYDGALIDIKGYPSRVAAGSRQDLLGEFSGCHPHVEMMELLKVAAIAAANLQDRVSWFWFRHFEIGVGAIKDADYRLIWVPLARPFGV